MAKHYEPNRTDLIQSKTSQHKPGQKEAKTINLIEPIVADRPKNTPTEKKKNKKKCHTRAARSMRMRSATTTTTTTTTITHTECPVLPNAATPMLAFFSSLNQGRQFQQPTPPPWPPPQSQLAKLPKLHQNVISGFVLRTYQNYRSALGLKSHCCYMFRSEHDIALGHWVTFHRRLNSFRGALVTDRNMSLADACSNARDQGWWRSLIISVYLIWLLFQD